MNDSSAFWKPIHSLQDLDAVIEKSKQKPVLVFLHLPSSQTSQAKKSELEKGWDIPTEMVDVYIADDANASNVCEEIASQAGIELEYPQVVLFADGVTMYDEASELISAKKVKLALKIVNRTFKWMETRA